MNEKKMRQIMAEVNGFPGMPWAVVKLLSLLDDPDTSVSQVEETLRYDPGLTANVLKLTNSAYFGMPSTVGSIRQAVVLLGSRRLIQLALASLMGPVLEKPVPGYDLPPGELWRHAIAVSVVAEILVRDLNIAGADTVFTAALLHDVGKLVIGDFVKDDLEKIESAALQGIPFELAEQSVLGTDHAEIGARILENWSFPSEIVDAVRWHHMPDNAEETTRLIDIVHVADMLTLMIGIGAGIEGLQHQPSADAIRRLGLKPFQLEAIASRTLQKMNELSEVFGST